ncbi:MAG TPA: trypsin-like peptidase domain-containing protein, partial [Fimbriimonas sp.]|nr:trypsin-like peptidase domain-containing protein [Fimbriimonas sp.]
KEMSQRTKTSSSVWLTLGSGFLVGAICMAAVRDGAIDKASADTPLNVAPRLMSSTSTESTTELHNLDNSFRGLAHFVGPAVVDIHSTSKRMMTENGMRVPESEGEGSGFIFSPDGYIATNDHVVGNADTVKVTLKDGHVYEGKVTRGNDRNSDIALVKIDSKNLPYLSFADSSTVEPGEFAMAIGAPFGFLNTVTVGHVSALGRTNEIEGRVYSDLIQTDASINMGNSGGPLVNVDGQVIGMNTAIFSPTGVSSGIGFAIPGNQVKLIENLLVTKGKIVRSMLGVIPEDVKEYERTEKGSLFPNGGARVVKVVGEPAQSAGFQKDDVIVRIGNTEIRNQMDLRNAMLAYSPGSTEPVEFIRNGKRQTKSVKLLAYKLPENPAQPQQPQQRSFGFPNMPNMPRQFFQFGPNGPNGSNPFGPDFGNQFDDQNDGSGNGQQPVHKGGPIQLGVQVQDVDKTAQQQYSIPSGTVGAVVVGVLPGSVADRLGLQPGAVITKLNGRDIANGKALSDAMKSVKAGSSVPIAYMQWTNGSKMMVQRDVRF